MISGIGFTELLFVAVLILIFFGSKEVPYFMREGARLLAKARKYSDKMRRELNEVARTLDVKEPPVNQASLKKKALRGKYLAARKALSSDERREKSQAICRRIIATDKFGEAKVIMFYVSTEFEVGTRECIKKALASGKRIVVPYCKGMPREMGIAEIRELDADLSEGRFKLLEPRQELRDNFLKSDIQLVICPGVAFDRYGGRLGRGNGYYDTFLTEIKGKARMVGLAYQCQLADDPIPFEYHDVSMDQVITEEGPVQSSA